jgi:hypothetical protein
MPIMSENSAKIDEILQSCETAVRDIIAAAAQDGDYDTVGRGREVALRVSALRLGRGGNERQQHRSSQTAVPSSGAATGFRGSRIPEYPRFELIDNSLYRYGWSKREKREYNHKAQKSAFDRVVTAMSKIGSANKGPQTAEVIIEQANEGSDDPIPNYQVYAVLGFLKAKKVIEQQGREGYLVSDDFESRAQQCWNQGGLNYE